MIPASWWQGRIERFWVEVANWVKAMEQWPMIRQRQRERAAAMRRRRFFEDRALGRVLWDAMNPKEREFLRDWMAKARA